MKNPLAKLGSTVWVKIARCHGLYDIQAFNLALVTKQIWDSHAQYSFMTPQCFQGDIIFSFLHIPWRLDEIYFSQKIYEGIKKKGGGERRLAILFMKHHAIILWADLKLKLVENIEFQSLTNISIFSPIK